MFKQLNKNRNKSDHNSQANTSIPDHTCSLKYEKYALSICIFEKFISQS